MAIRKRRRTRKRTRRRKRGGDDGYSSDTGFHKTIRSPEGFPMGTGKTGKGASIHLTPRQKRNQGIYKLASDEPSLRGMDAEKIGKIYDQQKEAATSKSRNARASRLALMKKKTRKQSAGKRKRRAKKRRTKKRKRTRRRRR